MIIDFLNHYELGYDVVYGIRETRKENWLINSIRRIFYRLVNILSEDYLPKNAGDFRLISRRILNVLM